MILRYKFILFLMLLLILTGMNGSVFAEADVLNLYSNKPKGFSIKWPDGWEWKEGEGLPNSYDVAFLSPFKNSKDVIQENCNVIVTAKPGDMTFEYLVKVNLANSKEYLDGYHLLEKGETSIADNKAAWSIYSFRFQGVDLNGLSYILAKGKMAYFITCVSEPAQFSEYKDIFEKIINSFRMIE